MMPSTYTVRCGSPTCRAEVRIPIGQGVASSSRLRALGWRQRQEPGDDRPRWYCRRCTD